MKIYEKYYIVDKWTLYQYVSGSERCALDDWRKSMPQGARRADMDTFLKAMVKKREWEFPDIDTLKGRGMQGLTELRWKSEGVPHRIFGYRLTENKYVCLIGCTHDAKKYTPPGAMKTARTRRHDIQTGAAIYREYKLLTSL